MAVMYQDYFHFNDKPFSIAPNPRYLYLSDQHREALAHLTYGLHECGGFIVLTGEVGTGKTTVCRCLLEQIPATVRLAMIFNPSVDEKEMLQSICDEFGLSYPDHASLKSLSDCLSRYLLQQHAQGYRAVVIIEEAQNLNASLLEQLRLLTNLESNENKLLQIILIGQPELLTSLARHELRQLSQRIVARFHLQALNRDEVQTYIKHRLAVAGCQRSLFPRPVVAYIARLSHGIPRVINLLCDRILLGCYTQEKESADMATAMQAAAEVLGKPSHRRPAAKSSATQLWQRPSYAVAIASAIGLTLMMFFYGLEPIKQSLSRTANADSSLIQLPKKISIPAHQASTEAADSQRPGQSLQATERAARSLLWPELVAHEHSEWDAYLTALRLWGIELDDQQQSLSPCQAIEQYGLDCWHKKGDGTDLIHLNRPAILKLHKRNGDFFYGVASRLDQGKLRLSFVDGDVLMPIEQLHSVWTEEYTVLWKKPPGFSKTIRPGHSSPVVGWLLNQLAHLQHSPPATKQPNQRYTQALINLVRGLQSACQLSVDGLLGKETIIRLNGLSAQPPRLMQKKDPGCENYYHG